MSGHIRGGRRLLAHAVGALVSFVVKIGEQGNVLKRGLVLTHLTPDEKREMNCRQSGIALSVKCIDTKQIYKKMSKACKPLPPEEVESILNERNTE